MKVKPEHEFFGREINFEDIQGIKKVFQPGILSAPYFFNPVVLRGAISELCGWSPKEILVYFNGIEDLNLGSKEKDKKREWWKAFQTFAPLVKPLPAGCEVEYWYGSDGKEFSLPEFKEYPPPYQALIKLFGNAIQGFSCFVNPNRIGFSSIRCNYSTIKPGEGLIHDKKSLWSGKSDIFLESAQILHNALSEMERRGYNVGVEEMAGCRGGEVRIIYPERGALVGRLYGKDSVGLLVENDSLEKIVSPHIEMRSTLRKLVA